MKPGSCEVIQQLLFHWDGVPRSKILNADDDLLNFLEKSGQVVVSKDTAHLVAPLMHFYWCSRLRVSKASSGPATIDELVTDLIAAINPQVLRASLSQAPGAPLLEAAWQFEVYRAVHALFPATVRISPGFGHGYSTDGAVNFIVRGSRGWAIEIIREGDRLVQHLCCFAQVLLSRVPLFVSVCVFVCLCLCLCLCVSTCVCVCVCVGS